MPSMVYSKLSDDKSSYSYNNSFNSFTLNQVTYFSDLT